MRTPSNHDAASKFNTNCGPEATPPGAHARPERYHIRNAAARMRALESDPNLPLLTAAFDPAEALANLQALFEEAG